MSRCVGCKKLKEDHKLRCCIYCNDQGPYCKKCNKCKACDEALPGVWTCGDGGDHDLPQQGFKGKCVDDDEDYWYCEACLKKCPCGNGDTHYLCKGGRGSCFDTHECTWHSKEGNKYTHCKTLVCRKYCGIKEISGEIVLFCPKHRPTISESLRNAVVQHIKENESADYKKRLREELE